MSNFQLVVAVDQNMGIGKDGTLPWKIPGDMAYFRELTSKAANSARSNVVIMGRATWESLPPKFRPLPGRINIVLTRSATGSTPHSTNVAASNETSSDPITSAETPASSTTLPPSLADVPAGVHVCGSLQQAADLLASPEVAPTVENVFVIGGGQVYAEALRSPLVSTIHITRIEQQFACDTFFPAIDPTQFRLWSASDPINDTASGTRYSFLCYTRTPSPSPVPDPAGTPNGSSAAAPVPEQQQAAPKLPRNVASKHEELQYLELVQDLIANGVYRPDRTGTGTFSRFGRTARYSLRHTFPMLTTKRVFWRGVVEELLWFVSGETDARLLQAKGVRIWDGNSSRAYLDSVGLSHREEGDLGPVYGFQWRHFGAAYRDMHADYTGQGVDQLAEVIHRLRTNPTDRRILLTAWNPAALHEMALPPCHMFCQFYVADGELSCLMYQRSCDVGLGVPFNIASYSLLTLMIAQVVGLQPGEFVHVMGDTHVYANHIEPLKEQLLNTPRHFPTLKINPAKKEIDSFVFDDFELLGYSPHKKIDMKMAV
ncbi:MAG: hypothetical protein WDW38_008208 [Sanguina aurantia]